MTALQPLAFQAGKGKQRSEQAAGDSRLQMLFNNAHCSHQNSLEHHLRRNRHCTQLERHPWCLPQPGTQTAPRAPASARAVLVGRRSRAGVAAARSQRCSLRGPPAAPAGPADTSHALVTPMLSFPPQGEQQAHQSGERRSFQAEL